MRPPEEVKKEIIRQWLAKADQDMRAGESLLATSPPLLYPACFHAQQAAEKYLKALLTWHQVEFPKTHAIEALLNLLQPIVPDLVSRLSNAVQLTPYGVEARYPGDQPELGLEESRQAVALAGHVRDTVLPLIVDVAAGDA
jgi:HEPN domain-containing protein